MTASTALLIWLYAAVNGQDVQDLEEKVKGEVRKEKKQLSK